MAFQSPLQAVLKVRQFERDVLQQSVATARQAVSIRLAERDTILIERESVLNELRARNDADIWDLSEVIQRQQHATLLASHLKTAVAGLTEAEDHLSRCLEQLLAADQAVQVIERLFERRVEDYRLSQDRIQMREFDDAASWAHISATQ